MTKFEIEEKIVAMLKTVFDPEIPVNVYDLGLIYKIDVSDQGEASIDMTLTAPNCPAADFIMEDVRQKIESIDGVTSATINLVFEPEWDKDMMSEEAKLELGIFFKSVESSKLKQKYMKNVYFLSDAHLGSRAIEHGRTQERRLVNFLDSIKH